MVRKETTLAAPPPPHHPEAEIETVIATLRLKLEEHCNDVVACCRQYAGAAAGD